MTNQTVSGYPVSFKVWADEIAEVNRKEWELIRLQKRQRTLARPKVIDENREIMGVCSSNPHSHRSSAAALTQI